MIPPPLQYNINLSAGNHTNVVLNEQFSNQYGRCGVDFHERSYVNPEQRNCLLNHPDNFNYNHTSNTFSYNNRPCSYSSLRNFTTNPVPFNGARNQPLNPAIGTNHNACFIFNNLTHASNDILAKDTRGIKKIQNNTNALSKETNSPSSSKSIQIKDHGTTVKNFSPSHNAFTAKKHQNLTTSFRPKTFKGNQFSRQTISKSQKSYKNKVGQEKIALDNQNNPNYISLLDKNSDNLEVLRIPKMEIPAYEH